MRIKLVLGFCIVSGFISTDTSGEKIPTLTRTVVPVAQLKEARQMLGSSEIYSPTFPPWINTTLLQIGQKFLQKNFAGFLYSVGLSSLLVGASTDARRIVISAGNTTDVNKAMKRYLINVLHFSYWSVADLETDKANLFETLNLLHAVHAKVGHSAHRKKHIYDEPLIPDPGPDANPSNLELDIWADFERDLLLSPLRKFKNKPVFPPKNGGTDYYLNQFAMAIQQWAFVAYPVMSPESMLIYDATDEELWGYIHFWGFVGHSVGIQEQYNVCLQPNLSSAKLYFRSVLEEYFIPSLFHLDYESKAIMEIGIKAIQGIFPFVDFGQALLRLCEDVLQIDCTNIRGSLTVQGRIYETVLTRIGQPLLHYDVYKSLIKFVLNGMLQIPSLKYFKLNTLIYNNLTNRLILLDEEILRTSDVYFGKN